MCLGKALLWRTNMAALGRGTAFLRFLRNNARILSRSGKPAGHKVGRWRNTVCTSGAALVVGSGLLCAVPFTQVQSLSHESLIRRAASLVTDSSSTFLSQTTLALIDAITEYSKAVHTLIALQKRYLASLGKLSQAEEDSIWQVMLGQRAEVNDRQEECKRFESVWVSALKLCETSAEAAYASGAEHASITMQNNIQVARSQVGEVEKVSKDAEKKLAEAKVLEVEAMTQHAATLEKSNNEEDVPEAYLRED
ncbi:diablo IAP-binding mitochondrial protein-like [Dunckerocampus dactyliophorus]|uniref:diablo IAP-binding mitochondrial protein-like n=1 Tax=Dunckerocampus dactyliophorus TaxID=161453 RepID=UPI002405143C|nr:diablo IAP-binding mitochondrial protein-like [Dunckerocampus dactyliophorus]